MILTPVELGLGSICISIVSASVGSYITGRKKVDCSLCLERRTACIEVIDQKLEAFEIRFDNMQSLLDKIWKKLENSNLSII